MLKLIADITGHRFIESDPITQEILRRIQRKLPDNIEHLGPDTVANEIRIAEAAVNAEGNIAISNFIKAITAPPAEKVLKIKSSPKGARIKIAAADGVRYSFGPIWNASVTKGKGIAYAENNRAKLNHQALMLGISDAESLDVQALGKQIAATFKE